MGIQDTFLPRHLRWMRRGSRYGRRQLLLWGIAAWHLGGAALLVACWGAMG